MEVRLLGPLEVRDGDRLLSVHGSRQRALLALLALNAGRVMAAQRLIELLWGDEAPPSATNALQVHVSGLRKVLEPRGQPYRLLVSDESGYVLKIDPERIDSARFERLVDQGHKALIRGEVAHCAQLLDQAANLWRGSALGDLADRPWSVGEARRLEELRVAACEDRIEAELALGRHAELIPELESLIAQYPFRERLRGQLMLALYRSGRQAEASDAFQKTRAVLVEELGMEPGPELQQRLKAILNQDASLGVPAEERPAARLDNLPLALTSFVGRGTALTQIRKLVSENRLVSLTGPGGVGKTRIAIEVARSLVGKHERGVWLVSLAALTDPALVPEAVAVVLAIRAQVGLSPTEGLIGSLRDREYLIVLDNCEHLIDACAQMVEAVLTSCPRVSVLATSREALGVAGEVVWSVPPMQLLDDSPTGNARHSEAVELFRQRAAAATGNFEPDDVQLEAVAQICRTLDGIPLAIELAAAKLRVVSLEELSARLDDRFRVLTGGSRTAMPRHQTLRVTIDWSYDLLPLTDRLQFQALSVFAGSFGLQAAEAVSGGGPIAAGDVLDALSNLVRKSLVQVDKSDLELRYRLMDTIREYGREKLEQAGQAEVLSRRHRDFYLDLAERAAPQLRGPNVSVWMARLTKEHDNIRAAMAWCVAAHADEELVRFAMALGWFWYLRCFFRQGRQWFDAALKVVKPASLAARVQLLVGGGLLAWAQGDYGPDRAMFDQALSIAQDIGDDALIGHVLQRRSAAAHSAGDFALERDELEESVRKLRGHGPPLHLAEALNSLGWVLGSHQKNTAAARPLLEEALTIARQCGDLWVQNAAFDSLANIEITEGNLDVAQALQENSVRTCTALGDAWALPYNLEGFVRLACARGQLERALRIAGSAARLRDDVGSIQLPGEKAQIVALIEGARAQLPAYIADAAWRGGWESTEAEAVSYALSNL